MKILITGCRGQLGTELQKQLANLEEKGGTQEATLLRDQVTEEEIARMSDIMFA